MRLIFIIIFFIIPVDCYAVTVFEDNFDDRTDWHSESAYNTDDIWEDSRLDTLGGVGSLTETGWLNHSSPDTSHIKDDPLWEVNGDYHRGSSGKCLQYNYEDERYMNGGRINNYLKTGYDELYISYWIKFPSGWALPGTSDFYKLFRVYTGNDPVNDTESPSSTYANTSDIDDGIKRSQNVIFYIVRDGNGAHVLSVAWFRGYRTIANDDYGDDAGYYDYDEYQTFLSASTFNMSDYTGEWVFVQAHIKLNTPLDDDGVIEMWLIPESDIGDYDIDSPSFQWDQDHPLSTSEGTVSPEFRTETTRHMNLVVLSDNISNKAGNYSHDEITILIDDYKVTTDGEGTTPSTGSPLGGNSHLGNIGTGNSSINFN